MLKIFRISILGVKRPLAILKQIMLQFVTANSAGFVCANDWVAPFISSRTNTGIPRGIGIYLYASNRNGMRKTGIAAHIDLNMPSGCVLAEFTFWPLGTVISFGEVHDERLTPIHHWTAYPLDYRGTVDLHLCVNPVVTDYPLDFRSESKVTSDSLNHNAEMNAFSEESSRALMGEAILRSGGDADDWIFSGHPSTIQNLTEPKSAK